MASESILGEAQVNDRRRIFVLIGLHSAAGSTGSALASIIPYSGRLRSPTPND